MTGGGTSTRIIQVGSVSDFGLFAWEIPVISAAQRRMQHTLVKRIGVRVRIRVRLGIFRRKLGRKS